MKKTAIAAFAGALISGNVLAASQFDGVYGGVSLGSFSTTSESTITIVSGSSNAITAKQKSDGGSAFGLLAGYGKTFNQFYIAGEFNYRSTLGKTKGSTKVGSTTLASESELGQSFSLSVLPGYLVMDDLLVYGRLSYGLTDAETKGVMDVSGTPFNVGYNGGLATTGFGVGTNYAFSKQLSVRGEVLSLTSSSYSFEGVSNTGGYKGKTDKISTTGMELSVQYRF